MDVQQIAAVLEQANLFRGMSPRDVEAVAAIVEERIAPPGQHVFFEGDLATEFFVLATGRIRVYVPGHGEELDIGIVGEGQMFGEGGMLDGGPRVASAIALEPSTVLTIPRDRWLRVIDDVADLNRRMLVALGASMRRYASEAIDFLFLDVEVPEFPPEEDVSR